MASTTVAVGSSIGLHARPAGIIADAVTELGADVTLALVGDDDEEPVDAGSALMIMTLGATFGDEVIVSSDDPAALEAVVKLVEADLDA
ncbi:HPr family phosphocarrier protein [Antrihabitans sp. YC2-6]|uniref:HPr family phosphocarrier protein n=1 Tax=Antrihabitans sp. YC2-6 TaxID=2799498 RepID=UPI0018F6912A|nr:HPr family phosphocarrier protein [Antrihabitans sp. YC2-6]MBJ8345026.1 HPr family phosphocarrier protein [Antrihabitans sp. YC2-6]